MEVSQILAALVLVFALIGLAFSIRKKKEDFTLNEELYVGMFCHFKDKNTCEQLLNQTNGE